MDNNYAHFCLKDRFATARDVPPVDDITNWFLLSSDEENGYTVLEFTRYWVTCDEEKDRVINVSDFSSLFELAYITLG